MIIWSLYHSTSKSCQGYIVSTDEKVSQINSDNALSLTCLQSLNRVYKHPSNKLIRLTCNAVHLHHGSTLDHWFGIRMMTMNYFPPSYISQKISQSEGFLYCNYLDQMNNQRICFIHVGYLILVMMSSFQTCLVQTQSRPLL